ncbi:MAG: aminotransferase class III-fold pyridoxal phosphate-dependent enzyme, partial [Actinomycetia bacterium]|nr:aminotransferase class III-fold pyridoxal phosphate-dependent enzyme [Actinomycetes bacterium]
VIGLLRTGEFQERAGALGLHLHQRLGELVGNGVTEVRGRGLWAGVDIESGAMPGRDASEALAKHGVLCKETHGNTLRVAPPLVIERDELDRGIDAIAQVIRR